MRDVWVLEEGLFNRLLRKLEEHNIKHEVYVGFLEEEERPFKYVTLCIHVNGKDYCKGRENV